MKNEDYIPKNINDVAAVERLKHLPFELVKEDVSTLLEWLQDGHWGVAEGIAEYLIPHVNEITQELVFVLNTDDGMWKYCIIYILIARSKDKLDPDLIKALSRIAEHPSRIEAEDAVDEAAKDIITNKVLCG
ncbi:DUF5071 domain-containing protein [Mucilaginibacter polytrichastri]|uniref:DUF5071 domain-containing protein n=1 Tax=Mucilaginibacter polytrichastri TaxID=1302689 RepID=A0A1Q5ZTI8_9SPHI|nr:DUF5071 domain-containing protein [Mucilaginibacter polytrichastri]OKS85081.1 hypothetical protein RG47T_0520 [Mucilaginibacter polytrichastri]SFS44811.1 protein of unknown function [Mucilaginibacter polytrichastri]